jgi:hypothetical protein
MIVIPASTTVLTKDSFTNNRSAEAVTFERGSEVRRLERGTFAPCISLRSICIAASVEFIGSRCFFDVPRGGTFDTCPPCRLEIVTFEAGSKLRNIEAGAFQHCNALKQLCIPASVEQVAAQSFPSSRHCRIEVESGNRCYLMKDDFVMELNTQRGVRYCSTQSIVAVPDEIETIGPHCFDGCGSVEFVTFGSMSKLSSIESHGFRACKNLKEIAIPLSVRLLGDSCFSSCTSLRSVLFGPGSRLDSIADNGFCFCSALESIIIPTSVKSLGVCSFAECRIANSPLPVDSKVVEIRDLAFADCSGLSSIVLPSSVEYVGTFCFHKCSSLLSIGFASPSHLQDLLDLPPHLSGFVAIPDSVEVLHFHQEAGAPPERTLTFGPDSGLIVISVKYYEAITPWACRSFLQVSSWSLKLFRMNLEFENPV